MADFWFDLGNPDEFSGLIEWCSDGRLLPLIDARYSLDQICAAFSHRELGAQVGKVAIDF
jgi:NADPH:quinone reductase-like Zn-dependent oxidoreductase